MSAITRAQARIRIFYQPGASLEGSSPSRAVPKSFNPANMYSQMAISLPVHQGRDPRRDPGVCLIPRGVYGLCHRAGPVHL